jgi:hypothetical protein
MSRLPFKAILLLTLLLACGGGGESTTAPNGTGIRIVAGAPVTDTVLARPLQALVAEARLAGQPLVGVVVRFEAMPSPDTSRRFEQAVSVAKITQNTLGWVVSDTTNSAGRASSLVQLGTIAGVARVVVSIPELGLADTAAFTVEPGNAARIFFTPRDTALLAGSSYNVSAWVTDRHGNKRSDPVTFTRGSNTASVDAAGHVTVGSTVGRGAATMTAGSVTDSARFVLLPAEPIALFYNDFGAGSIATARLDGSALKLLTAATQPAFPNMSPTGDLIAYQQQENDGSVIYVVDGAGARRRLVDARLVWPQQSAHFSGDGQFIYFSGKAPGDGPAVWRVRVDGTSLTKIVNILSNSSGGQIGVAPDGSRIAYSEYTGVTVMELATSAKTYLNGYGSFLEFSPDSKRLAYLSSSIIVANANGTSPKQVTDALATFDAGLTWLPGGSWLLVRANFGPMIINISTGEAIRLPPAEFYHMSAHP